MTFYGLVIFAHVMGMLGFAIALGYEWIVLGLAQRALTREQARVWIATTGWLPALAVGSLVFVVLTGCYLAAGSSAWTAGWMRVSLAILVLIFVFGGIGGAKVRALRQAGETADLRRMSKDPGLQTPVRLRASVAAAMVLLMVVRPDLGVSLEIAAAALAIGLLWSAPTLWHARG